MDDAVCVRMADSEQHLIYESLHNVLFHHEVHLTKSLSKISFHELHNEVQMLAILVIVLKLNNVLMLQNLQELLLFFRCSRL